MKIKIKIKNLSQPKNGFIAGYTEFGGKRIYIHKQTQKSRLLEVMMHELTHAALMQLKIRLSDKKHEAVSLAIGKLATKMVYGKENVW